MTKLTDDHRFLLRLLAQRTEGLLTGQMAAVTFGLRAPTSRATNRMRTLAKHGLVCRHEHNVERWAITEAGRSRLQEEGERTP